AIDNIPPELQVKIFSEVSRRPWHEMNPSVSQSSDSTWLRAFRTKISLPLICRSTWWAASKVLYKDVVIRRMGQFLPLARTMSFEQPPSSDLHLMVNSLRMDTCIVLLEAVDECRAALATILSRCPNLTSITHRSHPAFDFADAFQHSVALTDNVLNPTWFVSPSSTGNVLLSVVGSQLTHLDIHADLSNSASVHALHVVLQHTPCLRVLVAWRWNAALISVVINSHLRDDGIIEPHHDFHTLILPSLLDLRVDCGTMSFLPRFIAKYWTLPSLQQLTVGIGANPMDPMEIVERFGAGLLFLQFIPDTGDACFTPDQQDRLDSYCPLLEHLVLPALKPAAIAQHPIRSPSLKWLDIWTVLPKVFSDYPTLSWQTGLRPLVVSPTDSAAPVLASVRILDDSDAFDLDWTSAARAEWPMLFHP
ncbi:uncharacterized protein BXZ73DRAFT_27131, partial [Epithele typhae]|uniref:uncharacterized protein n=1 Tax=Epithele typhae TaxID=378194 RepID=UPI002008E24A